MSTKPSKSATEIDEELAEFTDHILSDRQAEESELEELRSLQGTISRLKTVVKDPPQASMQRIEKRLVGEWHQRRDLAEKKSAAWQKFIPGSGAWKNQPQQRWVLGSALIAFFLIVFFIFPIEQLFTPALQATAGQAGQYPLALFIIAITLVIGLLWFGRNKS
jgi:hypothetical protein